MLCFSRFVFVFVNYLIVRNAGQPGLGIFYLFTCASGLEQCHEHILNAVLDTVGAVFKLKTAKAFYVFSVKMPDLHTLFRNFIFLQINQFQIIPYINVRFFGTVTLLYYSLCKRAITRENMFFNLRLLTEMRECAPYR